MVKITRGSAGGGGVGGVRPFSKASLASRFALLVFATAAMVGIVFRMRSPHQQQQQQQQLFFVSREASGIKQQQLQQPSSIRGHEKQSLEQARGTEPGAATILRYEKTHRSFKRTKFTMDEFVVNGINLANYGFEQDNNGNPAASGSIVTAPGRLTEPYLLYESFNIDPLIDTYEKWWDLIEYHGELLKNRCLVFYTDKIAFKRFMQAVKIPAARTHFLKYGHELFPTRNTTTTATKEDYRKLILDALPRQTDFVAKPSHRSKSLGVWMVKYNRETNKTSTGFGKVATLDQTSELTEIATQLTKDLYTDADSSTWAFLFVKHGIIVEDRYVALEAEEGEEEKPALEFKVFTIWGRVWMAYWKRGSYRPGLVTREGKIIDWVKKREESIPDWIDWNRVVDIAERMTRNKDFLRVDIFVGIPAGHKALRKGASREEQIAAVEYVVNEVDQRPTSSFEDDLHQEGARLWMAGYKMGIYKTIANDEVPRQFLEKGYLTEQDAKELELPEGQWWNHKGGYVWDSK